MINAAHVSDWAATAEAQRTLPKLVRRLVNLTATTTQISVPSGESTSQPGWDGEVYSADGNAWVPAGHSCWEVSCEADVTAKANRDYRKRTAEYPKEYRASRSFVFATPRKWTGKKRWVEERRSEGDWLDVRAYDADDLEQWLEHSPGLALAFAEELGLTGSGVESLKAFLSKWLAQTQPAITADALLVGRHEQAEQFLKTVEDVATDAPPQPRSVKADSVEEAVAFVAAALRRRQELADAAVVVTHADGWRFVEKNMQIRVAIAASPEIAAHPAVRNGLVVVVPYASGDMTKQFEGVAGRLDGDELHLERPHHDKFEEALHQIGLEENDAQRLSVQCGRSWSVFRRQHAINPAVRRPAWLDHPSAPALSTLCLLGSWSSGKPADKEFVERLCGRRYSELEADLLELERLDDSPVLHIGEVWKAKSALELLALFGDRITDEQFERFFTACAALLGEPDPHLELPDEERYAAAIHGKVRPVSGLLMNAICDTLIKLAVRGAEVPALAARDIPLKIDALVRNLLQGADVTRWMSLSSHLPELAEASPEVFLRAVESSLAAADRPVARLLSESKTAGMGRCWHAGLLWALETMAWAPQRLTRVSLILAKLAETEMPGNWGNTPLGSLVDLYRSWFPQTSASLRQRIAALDVLAERAPDVAALLLDKLVNIRHDSASPTARPKWRDDDAGAGRGVTNKERHEMLVAALERQIALGQGSAVRLSALVRKLGDFDPPRVEQVLEQLREFEDATDEDKEILRSSLRELIHWHRNFDDQGSKLDKFLAPIEASYERLSPKDPVIRHAWLISDSWPHPPFRIRDGDYGEKQGQIAELRNAALAEILAERGWSGLEEFALHAEAGWSVGRGVPSLALGDDVAATWIVDRCGALPTEDQLTAMAAGILAANEVTERDRLLDQVFAKADERGLSIDWKIRLLTLCSDGPLIWKRAAALGPDAETLYWQTCTGRFWLDDAPDDLNLAIGKLLEVKRAASAFNNLHGKFATLDLAV